MPTGGAIRGLHGGYSERGAGGARSAGASPNDMCTEALAGGAAAASDARASDR
jgi:hypothetical protein